jgi:DNA polymerase III sliding clamp (beta) subunit (PCNA family)
MEKHMETTVINKGILKAVQRAISAASTDATRYTLQGVRIEPPKNGVVKVVACDGHILSIQEVRAAGAQFDQPFFVDLQNCKVIKAALKEIKLYDDTADLKLESMGQNSGGSFQLIVANTRLVFTTGVNYPDYEVVIPKKGDYEIAFDADLLARLTAALTAERPIIKLNFSGPKSPIRVTSTLDDSALGVIMPCRAECQFGPQSASEEESA